MNRKENETKELLLLALESILENSPDLIFVKDADLRYVGSSRLFAELVGYKNGKELVGKTDYDLFSEVLARDYIEDDQTMLENQIPIINHIEPIPGPYGENSYSSTSKYLICDTNGEVMGLYGIGRDVTAEVKLEKERESNKLSQKLFEDVKEKAEKDALTGLRNRQSFVKKVTECLQGYGKNQTHALLFIDLDSFKQVNDNLGHPFGDEVLKGIAKKLKSQFDKHDLIGRIGGDEFLVLLRDVKSKEEIDKKVAEIFKNVTFCQVEDGKEICVTCSIGVSMYRADGRTLEELYEEADRAMYQSKQEGKNRMRFYE